MAVPDFVWTAYGNYTPKMHCKVDAVLTNYYNGTFNFSRYTGPYNNREVKLLTANITGNIGHENETMVITDPENKTWNETLVAIGRGEVCAVFITTYPHHGHHDEDANYTGTCSAGNQSEVHNGTQACNASSTSGSKYYTKACNINRQRILCELRVQGMARNRPPPECDQMYCKHCYCSKCQIDFSDCPDQDPTRKYQHPPLFLNATNVCPMKKRPRRCRLR